MVVKLQEPHRQAVRIRVVLAVVGDTLAVHFRAPGRERQAVFELRAEIPEGAPPGDRDQIFVGRRRVRTRPRGHRTADRSVVLPDAGKIRLAIGGLGSGADQVRFPIGSFGNARAGIGWPLSEQCRGHSGP